MHAKISILFLSSILLAQSSAFALPDLNDRYHQIPAEISGAMKLFLYGEKYNNFYNVGGAPQRIEGLNLDLFHPEYIEFPENHPNMYQMSRYSDWIKDKEGKGPYAFIVDEDPTLPKQVHDVFFVERDGQKFVRFFLSPDDQRYGKMLESYLTTREVPYTRAVSDIVGVRTVSRSMIFFDPKTKYGFSYKPSTSRTQLDYRDRVTPMRWAHLNRRLNEYFKSMESELKYLRIAPEALSVGFPYVEVDGKANGDYAFQIRLMDEAAKDEKIHLSGFVFYDKAEATRIAQAAGKTYEQFWSEAFYLKGKAMAEMSAVLGFHYTSSHAQNFRWELNPDGTLSDHVVMLDLSDGRPTREIFEANGQHELLADWEHMVNNTNPIETESLGLSGFVEPNEVEFKEAMARGFSERISEVLHLGLEHHQAFKKAYSTFLGEKGTVVRIKDLKQRLEARQKARVSPTIHPF